MLAKAPGPTAPVPSIAWIGTSSTNIVASLPNSTSFVQVSLDPLTLLLLPSLYLLCLTAFILDIVRPTVNDMFLGLGRWCRPQSKSKTAVSVMFAAPGQPVEAGCQWCRAAAGAQPKRTRKCKSVLVSDPMLIYPSHLVDTRDVWKVQHTVMKCACTCTACEDVN